MPVDAAEVALPSDPDQPGTGQEITDQGKVTRLSFLRRLWRHPVVAVTTAVASFLLVWFALVAPDQPSALKPLAFLRIPIEGIVGLAALVLVPPRFRRAAAVVAGVALGLFALVKITDLGFYTFLSRPFDLVLDWSFFGNAMDFLTASFGRAGAVGTLVAALVLLALAVALMVAATLRLANLAARHRAASTRATVAVALAWVLCAMLGLTAPGGPVASTSAANLAYDRYGQIRIGLADQAKFEQEARVDAFADVPGSQLLAGLRGKDFLLTFVESYGRVAVEDPQLSPGVNAVLADGQQRLHAAGFAARSGFLSSPTAGGGSWLAHSTLLSGLWIDNEGRYDNLVASERLTIGSAFRKADWRTVVVAPAVNRAWPEARFFGYDTVYDSRNLGYRGPRFGFAPMPDQYTLSTFQQKERAGAHAPQMAELELISSHTPWAPLPTTVDWNRLGDGTVFGPIAAAGQQADDVWRSGDKVRTEYGRSIQYSLRTVFEFLERYGDDNTVLMFLGDHQPAQIVTGDTTNRDVPITIVAKDPKVLDRIAGWGWTEGLKPATDAPVWPMNAFRDRFLTAFGPNH
jgi:hypothetical protein